MSYYMSHKQMKKLAVGIVTLLMAGGFQASVSADTSKAIVGGETTLTEDRVVNVLEPAVPRRPYAGIFNESKGDPTVLDMAGHNLTIQSFEKKGGKEEGVAGPIGILGMQGSKIEIYSNKNQPNTPKSTITIHEVAMYNDAVAQGGGQYGAIGIKMGDTYRDKASTANIDTDVVIEKLLGGTWHTRGIEAYGPVTLNIKGTFKVNPGAIGILKPKSGNVFTSAIFFSEDKGKINIHTVDIDDSQKNTLRRGIYAANGGGNTSVASMLHIGGGIFKVKEDAKGDYYLMDLGKGARVYFNTNEDGTAIGTQTADLQGTIRMNGASAYIGLTNNSKWKGGVTGNGSLNLFLAEGSEWDTTNGGMGSTISLLNGTGGVIRQKDSGKLTIKNYKGNAYLYYAHEGNGEETANYKAGDTYIEAAEANSTIKIFTDAANIGDATKALNAVVGKLYYTPKDKNLTAQAYIAEGLMTAPAKTLEQRVDWKDNGQGVINATIPSPVPGGEGHPSAEDTFTTQTPILEPNYDVDVNANEWFKNKYVNVDSDSDSLSEYTINKNTEIDISKIDKPEVEKYLNNVATIYWTNDHGFVDMTGHSLTLNAAGGSNADKRYHIYTENKLVMKNVKELILKGENGSPKNYILIKGKNTGSVDISNGDQDVLLKVENNDEQAKTLITIDANQADNGNATDKTFFKLKGMLESAAKNATLAEIKNGSVSLDGVKFTTEGDGILSVHVRDGGIFNANSSFDGNALKANEKKHDVIIEGNILAEGTPKGKSGKIGLALNTSNSYFTGLIGVKKGEAHMILKDGAEWNHESKGGKANEIGNSSLNTFDGDKGFIYQKSDKKISIGFYKGDTTVFYEHKNQGTEAGDYTGGNIEIKKAVEGSSITVLTDNKNIDTSKDEVLNKVYNALAGKVYYDAYKNNEKNLKGKVGIAEGLLSTSTVLKLQDITWKTDNGQGEYKVATPPPAPKNEGPITKDETLTEDRNIKGTMNNARMLISGGFSNVYGGVAVFAKDNHVKVEMAGHNLDIQMSGFNNNHDIYGIFAKNRKKINITNETATGGKKRRYYHEFG